MKKSTLIKRTYRIDKEMDLFIKRIARKVKVSESEYIRSLILHNKCKQDN